MEAFRCNRVRGKFRLIECRKRNKDITIAYMVADKTEKYISKGLCEQSLVQQKTQM